MGKRGRGGKGEDRVRGEAARPKVKHTNTRPKIRRHQHPHTKVILHFSNNLNRVVDREMGVLQFFAFSHSHASNSRTDGTMYDASKPLGSREGVKGKGREGEGERERHARDSNAA